MTGLVRRDRADQDIGLGLGSRHGGILAFLPSI